VLVILPSGFNVPVKEDRSAGEGSLVSCLVRKVPPPPALEYLDDTPISTLLPGLLPLVMMLNSLHFPSFLLLSRYVSGFLPFAPCCAVSEPIFPPLAFVGKGSEHLPITRRSSNPVLSNHDQKSEIRTGFQVLRFPSPRSGKASGAPVGGAQAAEGFLVLPPLFFGFF